MPRPKVSVYIATSADGYIARDDDRIDFLDRVQGADDYGYAAFFASIDTLVMGRSTYDVVLGFADWPFAGKRVVVLTNRDFESRHGEERHAGELAPLLERLAGEGARHVYLDGGQVVQQGLAEGVVDELTISVVPVLLGSGRSLFRRGLPERGLALSSAESYASGLVQLRYRLEPAAARDVSAGA